MDGRDDYKCVGDDGIDAAVRRALAASRARTKGADGKRAEKEKILREIRCT